MAPPPPPPPHSALRSSSRRTTRFVSPLLPPATTSTAAAESDNLTNLDNLLPKQFTPEFHHSSFSSSSSSGERLCRGRPLALVPSWNVATSIEQFASIVSCLRAHACVCVCVQGLAHICRTPNECLVFPSKVIALLYLEFLIMSFAGRPHTWFSCVILNFCHYCFEFGGNIPTASPHASLHLFVTAVQE